MATVTLQDELTEIDEKSYELSRQKLTENQFDLLRSFALTSLLVMLVIGGFSGLVFTQYLSDSLIRRDAEVADAFLRSLTEVEGGPEMFRRDRGESIFGSQSSYDLSELVEHIATIPGVVRTNIFSANGTVLWSTQADLVGKRFSENDELARALQGEIVYELQNIREDLKAEYANFGVEVSRLVENYLPIKDQQGAVVAVVEMYKAPSVLFAEMDSARNLVWISVITATLFLYASLFWLIYRANRVIRDQQLRLIESETMVAVGEMASAVAHSIRNPLAAIRSGAELTTETSGDPVVNETSQDIITQIDRIELWLRELLIYSRPEGITQFKNADLVEILSLCLQGHEQAIKQSKVVLITEFDKEVPVIKGDSALLGQMFNSLLDNALEAMPAGGSLKVSIVVLRQAGVLQVQITDTGDGISQERLATIFESALTTKRGGLGIGMMLVKRIVDRHGGRIMLSSQVGVGTTATCVFTLD